MLGNLAAVIAAATAGLVNLRTDTSPGSFLPAGDPSIAAMQRSAKDFGGDPIVVLAESAQPMALLGPDQLPALVGLEGRLTKLPDVAVVYGPGTVLNQIAISSQNLLAQLSGHRDALIAQAEQDAHARGASDADANAAGLAAVGTFDERYGSLLARGLPAGLPTLHNPSFVDTVIVDRASGQPRPQWRFIVPTPNAIAILVRPRENLDQAGTERLVHAVESTVRGAGLHTRRLTVSGAPAVAADLGTQVRHEIPLLGALACGLIALCYVLIPWQRRRRDRLLPLAATLCATALVLAGFGWLGRPLSLGVIAFLPILVGIGSDFPAYLVRGTHRRPVLVAALASAAGFASLAVSPLPFIRDLGLALAAGVLVAVALALVFRRYLVTEVPEPRGETEPDEEPRSEMRAVSRFGLLAVLVLVAAGGWLVLPRLSVMAQPNELAAGVPAVDEAQHVEDLLGSSGEVQVTLRGSNVLQPAALDWMRRAEEAAVLGYGRDLRPIVSLPDLLGFLGPAPTPEQIEAGMRSLPSYLTGAVVSSDNRASVVSFGIKLQDLSDQRRLLDGLRGVLPPPPTGFSSDVVGLPVAAARGYEFVSGDRYLTNGLGIVLAGLVLVVGLRRRSDALRAVLAAAVASGWGLVLAWAIGIPLTPLTVALGSLTTATACEFTVLLATAGRGQRVHRTVAVAALAATLGYLALAASGLAMIRDFGLVLAATVVLSLVAARLVVMVLPPKSSSPVERTANPTEQEVAV